MRLALFGGTFDPPHVGHLLAAVDAYDTLALDRLIFVPAAQQPFKVGQVVASPEHRLAMTRLLAAGDPRFEVDPVEIDRAGLSFTVDTLAAYAERYPDAERFLLVGADVLDSFDQWRQPEEILRLARLVIVERSRSGWPEGADPPPPRAGRRASLPVGDDDFVFEGPGAERALKPRIITTRRVDVSSTEIRARVRAGRSIRGFVLDAVAEYVTASGLYR